MCNSLSYIHYFDTVQLQVSQFNAEDLVIDLFYWFDKSTKCKASLSNYCTFCDVTCKDIMKHVNTR